MHVLLSLAHIISTCPHPTIIHCSSHRDYTSLILRPHPLRALVYYARTMYMYSLLKPQRLYKPHTQAPPGCIRVGLCTWHCCNFWYMSIAGLRIVYAYFKYVMNDKAIKLVVRMPEEKFKTHLQICSQCPRTPWYLLGLFLHYYKCPFHVSHLASLKSSCWLSVLACHFNIHLPVWRFLF